MRLRVARVHYPVTVLGPGRRLAVWVQGCSVGCHGCVSTDTWVAGAEHEVNVAELVAACRHLADGPLDGITITGGEPFEQPEGLAALLDHLHDWRETLASGGAPPFDMLCYSGLPLRLLRARHAPLLSKLDAVIPEPYIAAHTAAGAWRGSANQPIVPLTPLGQLRYPVGVDEHRPRGMQVVVDEQDVWAIGIPRPGDLAAFEAKLAARGVTLRRPSWRS